MPYILDAGINMFFQDSVKHTLIDKVCTK